MKNLTSGYVIDPNTFEQVCRSHGYWIVADCNGAIGIMHGTVRACAPTPDALLPRTETEIDIDGVVSIVREFTTHYLKPATRAEFESAKAFGFGTEYDPEKLPDLMKLPDETSLDNS